MMKTERQERIQDKYEFENARVVEGKGIARASCDESKVRDAVSRVQLQ